jgi:hypothetical protein
MRHRARDQAQLAAETRRFFHRRQRQPHIDAPVIITGRKETRSRRLTNAEKEANRLVSRERASVEHGFANLKSWRILTKVRMNVHHATTLLRTALVPANCEVQR